jgi:hypothetical protein
VVDASLIDEAIIAVLSEADGRWQKVAMVVGRIGIKFGGDYLEPAARRIEALVQEGRLESQGNLKKWRSSEVRLRG